MQLPRSSGVLLHPTSLPGGHGVGDLGASSRKFVDLLALGGQQWWQVLPLNPADYLGSPYSATSAMAMSPLLCDLEDLRRRGWLRKRELPEDAPGRAVFDVAGPAKDAAFRLAFERASNAPRGFEEFCARHAAWLDDWTLFAALRVAHGGDWRNWPAPIVRREDAALAAARVTLEPEIRFARFAQWVMHSQWASLREYAAERGVRIIGDVPIFVAMDSADVWANREIFKVDANGRASVVAGVPPDYFSPTGQKWGNPVYRWDVLAAQDYAFWRERIRSVREQCDLVRIDHFRGFEAYWEVPAAAPTAETGQWRPGPGIDFFKWVARTFDEVPFIAEDLGLITAAVHELRNRAGLPGMKVMQFAFDGDPNHQFLPHTYPEHCVAYTGTHDNDTTMGWYRASDDLTRHYVRTYLSHADEGIVWAMIEALLASKARLTVLPFQDLHELGSEARMNLPGTSAPTNWSWRMTPEQLEDTAPWERLRSLVDQHGRAA